MRLRPRTGNRSEPEQSAPNDQAAGRSVLGDVSNKRSIPAGESGANNRKQRATKKLKSALNSFPSSSNTTTTNSATEVSAIPDTNDENNLNGVLAGQKRKRGTKSSTRSTNSRVTRSSTRTKTVNKEDSSSDPNNNKKVKSSSQSALNTEATVSPDALAGARAGRATSQQEPSEAEEREDVEPCNLNPCLIPEEYRLERSNFDGTNHTFGIAPIDRADKEDVLMVANYVADLFQHFYSEETYSHPRMYMTEQRDINARMRAILVDWLVEVHMKFRLVPETLYLCINIIDRYCNLVQVGRSRLQLVGVTALLIACKYEEIYPPEVRDCVYITDRAYQRQEVLDMEQDMLQRLRFKITVPTAFPFLQRFLNLAKASPLTRVAANYYMERTLQEHDLLKYRPSLVCAAAVILALNNPDIHAKDNLRTQEHPGLEGTNMILEYTGFKTPEIIESGAIIARKIGEEPVTASRRQLVAVKRKYDNRKYLHVSTTVELPSEKYIPRRTELTPPHRE